jgi:molybdate transport system substrate-binding protein
LNHFVPTALIRDASSISAGAIVDILSMFRALTPKHLCVALAMLAARPAFAAPGLTVLAPASAQPGITALAKDYTAKTGIPITVGGGARDKVIAALKAGQGDVVVLPSTDFADLPQVTAMTPLGHILIGVAVRKGAPAPDISTPDKFINALKRAKGVAYADPSAGTSAGKIIANLLSLPDLKGVRAVPVQGLAVTGLTTGKADIALQLLPELTQNPDVKVLGPVPPLFSAAVDFSAGIATSTSDAVKAEAFIEAMTAPAADAVWKANGLVSLAAAPAASP